MFLVCSNQDICFANVKAHGDCCRTPQLTHSFMYCDINNADNKDMLFVSFTFIVGGNKFNLSVLNSQE